MVIRSRGPCALALLLTAALAACLDEFPDWPTQHQRDGGEADEGGHTDQCEAGTTSPCYGGSPASRDRGACRSGEQICGANGRPAGACKGEVKPGPETCDGLDNDCDGKTDEREDLSPARAVRRAGVCAGAVKVCSGSAGWREPAYEAIPRCGDWMVEGWKCRAAYRSYSGSGKQYEFLGFRPAKSLAP